MTTPPAGRNLLPRTSSHGQNTQMPDTYVFGIPFIRFAPQPPALGWREQAHPAMPTAFRDAFNNPPCSLDVVSFLQGVPDPYMMYNTSSLPPSMFLTTPLCFLLILPLLPSYTAQCGFVRGEAPPSSTVSTLRYLKTCPPCSSRCLSPLREHLTPPSTPPPSPSPSVPAAPPALPSFAPTLFGSESSSTLRCSWPWMKHWTAAICCS